MNANPVQEQQHSTKVQPSSVEKIDLSRLEPPEKLVASKVEEITIDGICGVY